MLCEHPPLACCAVWESSEHLEVVLCNVVEARCYVCAIALVLTFEQ